MVTSHSPSTTDDGSALLATGRVEALSDGIIAIAATLLVLELHVPEPGEDVWGSLVHQLPSLAAYAVSFLTILIFWVNHPRALPRGVGGRGVRPFGRNPLHADVGGDGGVLLRLWRHLQAHPELLAETARPRAAAALRRSLVGPLLYLVAAVVALVSAPAALVVAAGVAGYFTLAPRHLRRPLP